MLMAGMSWCRSWDVVAGAVAWECGARMMRRGAVGFAVDTAVVRAGVSCPRVGHGVDRGAERRPLARCVRRATAVDSSDDVRYTCLQSVTEVGVV